MAAHQRQETQIMFNYINIKLSSHFNRQGVVHLVKIHLIYKHLTFNTKKKKWVGKFTKQMVII